MTATPSGRRPTDDTLNALYASNAAWALADERRHHEIAAEEVARLRAERDALYGFRDVVLLEVEHWDADSLDVLSEAIEAVGTNLRTLPADQTTEGPT